MPGDITIETLPDLVVLLRRDGLVLGHGGGTGVPELRPAGDFTGQRLDALWPEPIATLLRQLARKAIAQRGATEARFVERGRTYEARVTARGPDRALCVLRPQLAASQESADTTSDRLRPELDRRGFLRRFKESTALAAVREKPLAIAVIQLDGIAEIGNALGSKIAEQVMSAALLRLSAQSKQGASTSPVWYLGQLSESLLAVVVESAQREGIEKCVSDVCASLREPLLTGDAEFHLTPYAGVGILGQDATSPKTLLENARAACAEARRAASAQVCFFTDTLRLRALARLDIARELRDAIANRHIRLRYLSRHDLETGRLVARVGYLQWLHPLRGEIRPAEFLRVAETTGLAATLSRAMLSCLKEDFLALADAQDSDVRMSFGALRHHLMHEDFVADIERFLADGAVPADRLELRIAERAFVACDVTTLNSLARRGVRLVVDEVAREMASFQRLARAPLCGLQLDRAWVTGVCTDEVARKVCRAGISVATALGLTPIATGVDDPSQRDALLSLGCRYGTGDLFLERGADITRPEALGASA